jgi:hypothetical protein
MMRSGAAVCVAALMAGCSTAPREFRATLAQPVPQNSNFDADMRQCQVLVRKGVTRNFSGTAAQLVVGTGGSIAAGSVAGSAGSTLGAVAGLGSAAMLAAGPLLAAGVASAIKSGREKKYRAALGTCLDEQGYQVAGWERQKKLTKAEVAATVAAMQAASTKADVPAAALNAPAAPPITP